MPYPAVATARASVLGRRCFLTSEAASVSRMIFAGQAVLERRICQRAARNSDTARTRVMGYEVVGGFAEPESGPHSHFALDVLLLEARPG